MVSATVDFRVQIETPETLEEQIPYVLPARVFVALKAGMIPEIKLPLASFKVIVTVTIVVPSAVTGPAPAAIVEVALDTAPVVNDTVAVAALDAPTGVAIARVLVSAKLEARVQVEIPVLASLAVQALGCVSPPPLSISVKVGITLGAGLLFTSFKVIVIVEKEVPSAVTELVPVIVEKVLLAAPGAKTTFELAAPAALAGVTIARTLVSA